MAATRPCPVQRAILRRPAVRVRWPAVRVRMMSYRLIAMMVTVGGALFHGLSARAAGDIAESEQPPNVLFVIVDDLRPQLGAYGFEFMHTPSMDRLAEEGLLFRRAYSQWPVCGPSRASMLSGLRPDSSGIHYNGQRLRSAVADIVSLPEHFRNNGYRTLSIGKVYHARDEDLQAWSDPPWQAAGTGDNWQGYASAESRELRQRLWREALMSDPDAKLYQFNAGAVERAYLPDNLYRDGKIADKAVGILREIATRQSAGQPFFLAVGFVKPHLPFAAPGRYWDLYERSALRPPANASRRPVGSTEIPYIYSELQSYRGIPAGGQPTEDLVTTLIHGYYAAVSFVDAQVGKLLAELDRLDLRKNTIVVLAGDHGFHLGEQAIWAKHSLFELSLHTPLIVSVPAQKVRGAATEALVELVDIYPSLIELAGLESSPRFDGESFVPLLDDPDRAWKESALSQYRHFREPYRDIIGYSIRTDRYRYTLWQDTRQRPRAAFASELFDLSAGTGETINVADRPQYRDIVEELSARIDAALQ